MDNKLKEKTSKRIKQLRLERNFTMEVLAKKLNVSKSTIAKWENGYVDNMRQDSIMKLAEVFKVSPTYIMGYDETTQEVQERTEQFVTYYEQLDENQKTIIDNLLKTFVSKQ